MNIIPFLLELHISEHPIPRRMNPDLLELVLCMQLPVLGQNYLEEIGQNIQNLMEGQGDTRAFFNYITGGAKAPPAPMVAPPLNHFGPSSQSPFSLKYKQNMEFRREV